MSDRERVAVPGLARFHAWEAAQLWGRRPRERTVHAVRVYEGVAGEQVDSADPPEPEGLEPLRRGRRSARSLCGRGVGMEHGWVARRGRARPVATVQLQLHDAAQLAGMARCGACVRLASGSEWAEPMPLHGSGIVVDFFMGSLPNHPAYYRYRPSRDCERGRWLPYCAEAVDLLAAANDLVLLPGSRFLDWTTRGDGDPGRGSAYAAYSRRVVIAGMERDTEEVVAEVLGGIDPREYAPPWPVDGGTRARFRAAADEHLEAAARQVEHERQLAVAVAREAEMRVHEHLVDLGDPAAVESERRAEALLADLVGTEAYASYRARGHLDVRSPSDPDKAYRLRPWKRVGLLSRWTGGERALYRAVALGARKGLDGEWWREGHESLCVHPDDLHPAADELAALVMMIRAEEGRLLATANVHGEPAHVALEQFSATWDEGVEEALAEAGASALDVQTFRDIRTTLLTAESTLRVLEAAGRLEVREAPADAAPDEDYRWPANPRANPAYWRATRPRRPRRRVPEPAR